MPLLVIMTPVTSAVLGGLSRAVTQSRQKNTLSASAASSWGSSGAASSGAGNYYDYMSAIQAAADRTSAESARQADLNRQWQAMMSNTAHQREMADLKAAGLNPVLAANSGASTPSGAQGDVADSSGAIAGLLGQIISAQSAQSIANAHNASARLIEAMKESHNLYTLQHYPQSANGAAASILNAINPAILNSGQGMWKFLGQLWKGTGVPYAWRWIKSKF